MTGEKEYHCRIESAASDEVCLHILYAQEPDYELQNKIYLFQGLPKSDKMELIIQKAVELGAFEIIPVETKRCVVRLDGKKAAKKTERWQQSQKVQLNSQNGCWCLMFHSVMSYRDAIAYAEEMDVCLIPYELAKGMAETKEIIKQIQPGQSIGIFIGPEGGFEESEVETAVNSGVAPITLGKRILRRIAGLAILSVLMFQLEQ